MTEVEMAMALFHGANKAGDETYSDGDIFVQCTGDGRDRHVYFLDEEMDGLMVCVATYVNVLDLFVIYDSPTQRGQSYMYIRNLIRELAHVNDITTVEVG